MLKKRVKYKHGYTLMELMIVLSIIAILLAGATYSYSRIIERSRINQALADIQEVRQAVEAYHVDLGFYPPDTGRGIDPGLAAVYNPASCGGQGCPRGYDRTVIANASGPVRWRGPYLDEWPDETPWGGEYDYNYWQTNAPGGCSMVLGMYVAIRPRLDGTRPISPDAERYFIREGADGDRCTTPNGDVHILLKPLLP